MPKLRPFQREDVEAIKKAGVRALIASSMGTGKTPVTIRAVTESWKTTMPALVVAPASVTENWAREIHKWAPGFKTWVFPDTVTKPPRPTEQTIYVISWDILRERWSDLVRMPIKCVVADEVHMGKNEDAQRTQALLSVLQGKEHVLLLSGTPIVNDSREYQFIKSMLGDDPLVIRRLLEVVAKDIPEKKRSYIPVRLNPHHKRRYDKAENDFEEWLRKEKERLSSDGFAEAEVERALANEALVKMGYLRRLAGEAKVPAAIDWVSRAVRLGEPVVVFAEHKPVIQKLSRGLKKQNIRHVILDGAASAKDRQAMIDQFQRHEVPVFIGSKAAKEGITLIAARHLLFVERFYTSADEEQAEDRIRRIGQKHPTTIWFLHALQTVDDRLDQIVRQKRRIVQNTIGLVPTRETPRSNALELLHRWGEHVEFEGDAEIGQRKTMPSLPRPRRVRAVVFKGKRWKKASAMEWCKMNGYTALSVDHLSRKYQVNTQPSMFFVPGSFQTIPVADDISIIVGRRRSSRTLEKLRAKKQRGS